MKRYERVAYSLFAVLATAVIVMAMALGVCAFRKTLMLDHALKAWQACELNPDTTVCWIEYEEGVYNAYGKGQND